MIQGTKRSIVSSRSYPEQGCACMSVCVCPYAYVFSVKREKEPKRKYFGKGNKLSAII